MTPLVHIRSALLTCIALIWLSGSAYATAIPFTETFLAGDEKFILQENDKAEFSFDLGGPGGKARLLSHNCNDSFTEVQTAAPSPDEMAFQPGYEIVAASLTFVFSSYDWPEEQVQITTSATDGDETLYSATLDLSACWWCCNDNGPAMKAITIDLGQEQLLDYLEEDGKLVTFALAMKTPWYNRNDFAIESVSLQGEFAPVPEPASMTLFGMGLIGVAGIIRKKRSNLI